MRKTHLTAVLAACLVIALAAGLGLAAVTEDCDGSSVGPGDVVIDGTVIRMPHYNGPVSGGGAGVIPEPATIALLGAGLAGLALKRRRAA